MDVLDTLTEAWLDPDVVTPEQFLELLGVTRNSVCTGERALMATVLKQAISVVTRGLRYPKYWRNRDEFRRELRWILKDDYTWEYSFLNLCTSLGIDPKAVRAKVLANRPTEKSERREQLHRVTHPSKVSNE